MTAAKLHICPNTVCADNVILRCCQWADWVDPTRSEDVPVQEVGALKKCLVASERERKQALADAAAENRALQLQL